MHKTQLYLEYKIASVLYRLYDALALNATAQSNLYKAASVRLGPCALVQCIASCTVHCVHSFKCSWQTQWPELH